MGVGGGGVSCFTEARSHGALVFFSFSYLNPLSYLPQILNKSILMCLNMARLVANLVNTDQAQCSESHSGNMVPKQFGKSNLT